MPDKYLRREAVEEIVGLSRTSIYRLMDQGQFPRPVRITGKAVRWPQSAIEKWQAERAAATV